MPGQELPSQAAVNHRVPTSASAGPRSADGLGQDLAALIFILFAAISVRAVFIGDPMRYDEAYTYRYFVSLPWWDGISSYPVPNNHLLNTLLAHFTTELFGRNEWAIRLPAFVAGCLLVFATYMLARVVYGREAALITAGLVAGSSVLIEYSVNARGYSFVVLFFVLLLIVAISLTRRSALSRWLLFALLAALGMFAVPTMAFAIGVVAVWYTAEVLRQPGFDTARLFALAGGLVATALLTVALYMPIIRGGAERLLQAPEHLASVKMVLRLIWDQWTRETAAAAFLSIAALVAVICHRRVSKLRVPPAVAALPILVPAFAFAGESMPYPRSWLFLLPVWLAAAGAGISWAIDYGRRVLAIPGPVHHVAAVMLTVVMVASVAHRPAIVEDNEGRDGPAITTWLKPRLTNGAKVVSVTPHNIVLIHYFEEAGIPAEHVVGSVEESDLESPLFVVVPNGKTLKMLTGEIEYPMGEGEPYAPIPGLRAALGPDPSLVRTYPTARIYIPSS